LEQQAKLLATWSDGLRWSNALLFQNGGSLDFSHSAGLSAEHQQANTMQKDAIAQTLYGLAGEFQRACWYPELDENKSVPYSILYLEWEVAFPDEWRAAAPWSPWGLKQQILRGFTKVGALGQEQALIELVMAAVEREQRCEDRWYAAVARHLDSPELRAQLADASESPDLHVRLRAGYVSAVLDDRSMAVTLGSWRRWVAAADSGQLPEVRRTTSLRLAGDGSRSG
jgi:hypothetical protein